MTKERLRNYKYIRREVTQLQDQLRQLRLDMASPRSPQLSGMPHGSAREGSALDAAVAHLVDLERVYMEKLDVLAAEQLAVETAIASLDSVERQLMRARYIDGLRWEEVCFVVGYSWQQTHRIHARALRKICGEEK